MAAPRTTDWDPRLAARRVSVGSLFLVVASALAGTLAPGAMHAAGPALLVVAGIVGLPHGAVDHLALGWARGRTGPAPAPVLVAYGAAAVLVAGLAVTVPLPAVLALLALSVLHFAEGEAAFTSVRGGTSLRGGSRSLGDRLGPPGGWQAWLPAAAVGVVVVVVPLELRPGQVRGLLAALDPGLPAALAGVRAPLLSGTALLVCAALVAALRGGQHRVAAELAAVAAAMLLGPPLLVFAAWFAGWHSPRHLVRLLALEPSGDGRQRMLRLGRGAAGPTAVAGSGLLVLWLLLGGLPGAVLIVLLALTVPHAAIVARLPSPSRAGQPGGPLPLSRRRGR